MANENKTTITPSKLEAKGWVKLNDAVIFMEKKLPNLNPLNDDEETDISLIWHRLNNTATFAVQLGESGMLNINVNTMEELKYFEDKLLFFDPNF